MRNLSICLLALFSILAAPTSAAADESVQPPGSGWHERSGEQLAAEWWQWAFAQPKELGPVSDTTGARCSLGQRGDLWFLAGGFGSSKIRRSCTVPAGTALFFPIINMIYYPSAEGPTLTCEQSRRRSARNNDKALDLFAEVDGAAVPEPARFRIAPQECFNLFGRLPADQRPYEAYPASTDGYWLLLRPLAPGVHVVKFGGRYNRNSAAFGRMVQDIEYRITVK